MSINDFEIIKQLGKGVFGIVLLARRREDNKIYAIKRVQISNLNQKEKQNALNEVRILASISHQNIIGYKESFYDDNTQTLNLVLEFADDGDLATKIQNYKKSNQIFKENEIWSLFIQMIKGLKVLHEHQIMHRDLKSANIFLTKSGTCKLGDLNVSKVVKKGLLYTQTGTPYFASPEVWMDKPYDYKSDIWSVGCILYEMCSLSLPFKGKNFNEVYKNVINGHYEPIPQFYSDELSKVVSGLLQVNPNNRPTCEQILQHGVIKKKIELIFGKVTLSINHSLSKPSCNLLGTIRFDDDKEIQKILPKSKKYTNEIRLLKPKKTTTINCENHSTIQIEKGTKIRPLYKKLNTIEQNLPLKSIHTESGNNRKRFLSKNNSLAALVLNTNHNSKQEFIPYQKMRRVTSLLRPISSKFERSKTPSYNTAVSRRVKPIIDSKVKNKAYQNNYLYTNSTTNTNSNQIVHETPHKGNQKSFHSMTTEKKVNTETASNSKSLRPPRPEIDPFKMMMMNPIKIKESRKMNKVIPTNKHIKFNCNVKKTSNSKNTSFDDNSNRSYYSIRKTHTVENK